MRSPKLLTLLALMMAIALAIAACGDGTDDTADPADDDTADDTADDDDDEDADDDADEGDEGDDADDSEASEDGFFAGKTIEIITHAPGGNPDILARVFAAMFERYVDGRPRAQVVNIAGGGGLLPGNQFALERDLEEGTYLYMASDAAHLPYLLGLEGVEFDFADMIALFSTPNSAITYIAADTGIETLEQLLDPPVQLVVGASHATSPDIHGLVNQEAFGMFDNVLVLQGYDGGGARAQAFNAGELNINRLSTPSFLRNHGDQWDAGEVRVLWTHGIPDGDGGLLRDPVAPDVPHAGEAYEIMHGEPPSGIAWDAYMALTDVISGGGNTLWASREAPPEAVEAIEVGIERMLDDPAFQEGLDSVLAGFLDGDSAPLWGTSARAQGERIGGTDPEVKSWLQDFLNREFDLEFN